MIQTSDYQLSRNAVLAIVVILFLILGMELFFSVRQQSQTMDESVHILAGYQYWNHRDFGANPEHPPLVKLVSTISLLGLDLKETEIFEGHVKGIHAKKANEFLYDNSVDYKTILFRTRTVCILFPIILALLLFVCCYEMFGQMVALFGLVLLVFEPNILANGALVTTDLAAACFIFASVYAFYRYIKSPNWKNVIICCLCVSLAFASKHSSLILIPILILLAISEFIFRCRNQPTSTSTSFKRMVFRLILALTIIFVIATVSLWAFYSFRFTARPDGFGLTPDLAALINNLDGVIFPWLIKTLWQMRLLPESFLWGLADVFLGVSGGRPTFLLGQVYSEGKWFFFPLVFLMKSTLPFLLLLVALPFTVRKIAIRRELIFLILPPVFYLVTSVFSGMNLGVRHILPIFPFLIILAALSASRISNRSRFASYAILILLFGHAISSVLAYPNYLTYSNEIVGGPKKTYRAMSNSDADWGQGLFQVSNYLSERSITNCWYTDRGITIDPADYGIPCRLLPTMLGYKVGIIPSAHPPVVNGTILISSKEAAGTDWGPGELNPYRQFFDQEPDDIIANYILVFNGTFDISLAAALVHAGQAKQFLDNGLTDEALKEAQLAVKLAPDSAEIQAGLCLAMKESGSSEADDVCQKAINIANRVFPEYQFKNLPNVKAVTEKYSQGIQ